MFISANNTIGWLLLIATCHMSTPAVSYGSWYCYSKDQCCLFLPALVLCAWPGSTFPAHLGTFGDEPFIPAILKFLNDLAFVHFIVLGTWWALSVWIFLYFRAKIYLCTFDKFLLFCLFCAFFLEFLIIKFSD